MRVLHEHHVGHRLVEIPDQDRGDAGIDAFSLDGCVYQCYAPENEPLDPATRYAKQRTKMTDDVAKFIENKEKLIALLPAGLLVKAWILLVPHVSTKRLVEHASTRTTAVRDAALPYASDDIVVVAATLDSYAKARATVISRQLAKLELPPVPSVDFSTIDDDLIEVMSEKLSHTQRFAEPQARSEFMNRLLQNQLSGRAHREHIRDHYPEVGDELEDSLEDLEDRLSVQYALDEPAPDRRLLTVIRDTESVVASVLNARPKANRIIAEGQIADWLIRCPLDLQ